MSNESIDDLKRKARSFRITKHNLGWIVAAALLIYFNTGIRAFAAETGPAPAQLEWNTVLKHFQVDSDKFVGQRFLFSCPERTVRDSDDAIHGTGIYPSDSPICVAAVHAGAITRAGGEVLVQLNPGAETYHGSEQNELRSADFPQTQRSIVFIDALAAGLDPIQEDYAPRLEWDTKFTSTGLANM